MCSNPWEWKQHFPISSLGIFHVIKHSVRNERRLIMTAIARTSRTSESNGCIWKKTVDGRIDNEDDDDDNDNVNDERKKNSTPVKHRPQQALEREKTIINMSYCEKRKWNISKRRNIRQCRMRTRQRRKKLYENYIKGFDRFFLFSSLTRLLRCRYEFVCVCMCVWVCVKVFSCRLFPSHSRIAAALVALSLW